jgi:2-oxoglutarate dehydrogenase E1 component
VSSLDDCARGRFQRVLPDNRRTKGKIQRVLLCSGKLYYELAEARERRGRDDIALVRIEQFYPLPESQLGAALKQYPEGTPVYWVQEEPENMGAWYFLRVRIGDSLCGKYPFQGVSRPPSASPATGSSSSHRLEQKELIDIAMGED